MPSFTRSFVTLFLLGVLVPVFESAPISYPDDERVHPRISYPDEPSVHPREPSPEFYGRSLQRRSLHPVDTDVNSGMLPRFLHEQAPLNAAIEPRRLHVQIPLNAEIEPRRLYRRHLFPQVPLNADIEPRGIERRGLDDAEEAETGAHHDLKLPHHHKARLYARDTDELDDPLVRRIVIPFTVHPWRSLWGDLNWRPRIRPFQSIPSYSFWAPSFKAHHIKHSTSSRHHAEIDVSVHKKTDADIEFPSFMAPSRSQRDPALVLQPRKALPGSKMKVWGMSVASSSEERIVNGHRDAKARELITVHSAHSPSAEEAKKNGGKLVESGEAVLITAKTPKKGSANAQSFGKPEVTINYAVLGPKKDKGHKGETDDKLPDSQADKTPTKPASPQGAGADEEGKDS